MEENFQFNSTHDLFSKYNVDVVGIKIQLNNLLYNIISLYIPSHYTSQQIQSSHLNSLISGFQHPFIITGDFNCHNTLWGDHRIDTLGKTVEDWMDYNNLTVINDGSPTHIPPNGNNMSSINLT